VQQTADVLHSMFSLSVRNNMIPGHREHYTSAASTLFLFLTPTAGQHSTLRVKQVDTFPVNCVLRREMESQRSRHRLITLMSIQLMQRLPKTTFNLHNIYENVYM